MEWTFTGVDIGSPAREGSTTAASGGYDVIAGGKDIWGSADQFHFSYRERTGDFDFTVRMESLSRPDLYTKAGLMARESLDAGSPHVYYMVFPDNSARNKNNGGYELQYRVEADGKSAGIYPSDFTSGSPEFPVNFPQTWLRLKRTGDDFEALFSADGMVWKPYAALTQKLSPSIYLGFAVTAHRGEDTAAAAFRDIALKL